MDESNFSSASDLRQRANSLRNKFNLTLENFDSVEVPEDFPFVLTSPRSLEACRRLQVKVRKKTK